MKYIFLLLFSLNAYAGLTVSQPPAVLQVLKTITGAVSSGTTTIPYDDTIPQITEGNEYMTLAITPKSTTDLLRIDVVFYGGSTTSSDIVGVALFQDSTANALAAGFAFVPSANVPFGVTYSYTMTAGTTSSTTFRVRAGGTAGTVTFNGVSGGRKYGGALASSIIITEYYQ